MATPIWFSTRNVIDSEQGERLAALIERLASVKLETDSHRQMAMVGPLESAARNQLTNFSIALTISESNPKSNLRANIILEFLIESRSFIEKTRGDSSSPPIYQTHDAVRVVFSGHPIEIKTLVSIPSESLQKQFIAAHRIPKNRPYRKGVLDNEASEPISD